MKDQLTEDDVVVIIFHDHGSRYVGKIYNDDWMRDRGFLDSEIKVMDILSGKKNKEFYQLDQRTTIQACMQLMKEKDISQAPVVDNDEIVGSISLGKILSHLLENPSKNGSIPVSEIMEPSFPTVDTSTSLKDLNKYIDKEGQAVIATDNLGKKHIITQYDIIQSL